MRRIVVDFDTRTPNTGRVIRPDGLGVAGLCDLIAGELADDIAI